MSHKLSVSININLWSAPCSHKPFISCVTVTGACHINLSDNHKMLPPWCDPVKSLYSALYMHVIILLFLVERQKQFCIYIYFLSIDIVCLLDGDAINHIHVFKHYSRRLITFSSTAYCHKDCKNIERVFVYVTEIHSQYTTLVRLNISITEWRSGSITHAITFRSLQA